jgi:septal ring factor EnvC (AmiA/AmiB activator)
MAKKNKTNWALLGAVAGVCLAPFTGGASLAMAGKVLVPTLLASGGLGFIGGKVVEAAVDNVSGDDGSLDKNLEVWKVQTDQWKALMDANRAEVERLQKERENNFNAFKQNNDEVARLNAIINDPNRTEEEKSNARKRIVLLEDENKQLKEKMDKIDKKLEELSKAPVAPSRPWSSYLPNLSAFDKIILASGTVLILYLIIPTDKKNKKS